MAKKAQISFVCQECGYDSPKFLGKCPECGLWNSMKEIRHAAEETRTPQGLAIQAVSPKKLSEISLKETQRIQTGFSEMDTVLGGGLVLGGVVLLAGDPGIGKSTLLLQLCIFLAKKGQKVLYISGEESAEQISLRARRIAPSDKSVHENLLLLAQSNVDQAVTHVYDLKPEIVIVDSIQTMQSENVAGLSGSIGQVRYAALCFIRCAKQNNIPTILVGHVTKEGTVAGPMVLSHMVDTVLFLEGERFTQTRIMRGLKNRFGPVDEVGIFLMGEKGMDDATDPEHIFLSQNNQDTPGSVLVVTMEGSRAFLVELQSLVVYSKLPMPRRTVSGIDQKRVELLLAVLQKHARLPLDTQDVFVNVAGGLRLSDPAIDLGVCLAVYSSLKNISFSKTVGIAEVGLLGELRDVPALDKREKEARKLGFKNIISRKTHKTLSEVLMSIGSNDKA